MLRSVDTVQELLMECGHFGLSKLLIPISNRLLLPMVDSGELEGGFSVQVLDGLRGIREMEHLAGYTTV